MTQAEFDSVVADAMQRKPKWFELDREPPASDDQIRSLERELNVSLPSEYCDFLRRYGAGHFAFVLILGVAGGTGWELAAHARTVDSRFIPVCDTGTGDFYGFILGEGGLDRAVAFRDHETGQVVRTQLSDFYEFVARHGLKLK